MSAPYSFAQFLDLMGMTEMECGVADILNKAHAERCKLRDVRFRPADLTTDRDAFHELRMHGWIEPAVDDEFRATPELVERIHRRLPNV